MNEKHSKGNLSPLKLTKSEALERTTELRYRLVELQNSARRLKIPVIILFAGVDGAGKHETVNLLNDWMDPRGIKTRSYAELTEEERLRPPMWRYWRDLPRAGEIVFFVSAWNSKLHLERVRGELSEKEFEKELEKISLFEKNLADNGYLILKFWMHLDQAKQKERLVKLSKDELRSWQIKKTDWENVELYKHFTKAADLLIKKTNAIPWNVVDGSIEKMRSLCVAEKIVNSLEERIQRVEQQKAGEKCTKSLVNKGHRFAAVDLEAKISKDIYKKEILRLHGKLSKLQAQAKILNIPTVIAFEGWDASGKGGAIRRVTTSLDAREYDVIPIAAPTREELDHHYLWRFWKNLPRGGRIAIFDRSWYGRVLVERVEGFADKAAWHRAFQEINSFEKELVDYGTVLCKFWLHISKDEQLQRFNERASVPYKAWKLCDDDWRNREKWDLYVDAAEDMFALTETAHAPWHIIPANQKQLARMQVMSIVCEALEKRLALSNVKSIGSGKDNSKILNKTQLKS